MGLQVLQRRVITLPVGFYLYAPEILPRRRPAKQRAIMPMPEAAMNKDDGMPFRKNEIRLSGQVAGMQPVPKTTGMQPAPDQKFGSGILSPDYRHVPAAGFGGVDISQLSSGFQPEEGRIYAGP